jgi:hypothetical protein
MSNLRDPSDKNNRTLIFAGAGVILVLLAGLWLFQGPSKTTSVPTGTLTGQASSSSGSTVVGAPPSTQPHQTSGQAAAPSGSNTTGSVKP